MADEWLGNGAVEWKWPWEQEENQLCNGKTNNNKMSPRSARHESKSLPEVSTTELIPQGLRNGWGFSESPTKELSNGWGFSESPTKELSDDHWKGYLKDRQEVIETALGMNAAGINEGTSGNVSVRVPGGFLITGSGIPYSSMTPEQVVYVDDEGGYYGDFLPSSEWRMHKDIYTNEPAAKAVVHTHSTCATALACQRRPIPAFHYMIGAAGGKIIPCAAYGTFGTQELSDNILKAMREAGTRACLMANHGVICHAANLKKALGLAVEIECLAKQYNYSCTFGPPIILDDAEMDVILAKFKTYGKQMSEIKCMGCFDQTHAVIPPPRRDKPSA